MGLACCYAVNAKYLQWVRFTSVITKKTGMFCISQHLGQCFAILSTNRNSYQFLIPNFLSIFYIEIFSVLCANNYFGFLRPGVSVEFQFVTGQDCSVRMSFVTDGVECYC